LIQLKHPRYAGEIITVGSNRYQVQRDGVVTVDKGDAGALETCGFSRIGEVPVDSTVRLPDSAAEFLAMCERIHLTGEDLRQMANFLDAHSAVAPVVAVGEKANSDAAQVQLEPPPTPPLPPPPEPMPEVETTTETGTETAEEGWPSPPTEEFEAAPETTAPAPEVIPPDAEISAGVEVEKRAEQQALTIKNLRYQSRNQLLLLAEQRGISVDRNWGRQQIISQILQSQEIHP
jgi:hypothetical protein